MKSILEVYQGAKALYDLMVISLNDHDNTAKYISYEMFAKKYNLLLDHVAELIDVSYLDKFNVEHFPDHYDLVWLRQKEIFDSVLINLKLLISLIETKFEIKIDKIIELKNFLSANIRKAIFTTPKNEFEIQNAIESLLIGKGLSKGIDYDREKGRVKVSIKEVIPDFILHKLNLALEVKFTKELNKTKSIVDQINADIIAYSKKFENLMFIVYDLGTIRDENEFKGDIESQKNTFVVITKH